MDRTIWVRTVAVLALSAALFAAPAPQARAGELPTPRVLINGTEMEFPADQRPILDGGRTLLPMRALFEGVGAQIAWDEETQTVTATRKEITITLANGARRAVVNDHTFTLDQPPRLVGSRLYVPARFVSESLGARVTWEAETFTVDIYLADFVATRPSWLGLLEDEVQKALPDTEVQFQIDGARRVITAQAAQPSGVDLYQPISDGVRANPRLVRLINRDGWRVRVEDGLLGPWRVRDLLLVATGPEAPLPPPTESYITRQMTVVPPPGADESADAFSQASPWAVASHFLAWYYGANLPDGPYAPAVLLGQVVAPDQPPRRIWPTLLGQWQEGETFFFRVLVTVEQSNGRLQRDQIAGIAVTKVPERGLTVTGFGVTPWQSDQAEPPIRVWLGHGPASVLAPEEAAMPLPGLVDGRHLVPLRLLAQLGQFTGDEVAPVLILAEGVQTPAFQTVQRDGNLYVPVEEIVAYLNGRVVRTGSNTLRYQVDWRPEIMQLVIHRVLDHPLSIKGAPLVRGLLKD